MANNKSWERMPGEPEKAFFYFSEYLKLKKEDGVRIVDTLAKNLGKTPPNLYKLSRQWNWKNRAADYDRYIFGLTQVKSDVNDLEEMGKRQAKLAKDMQAKAAAALALIRPEKMRPGEIVKMVDVAVKIERLARGAPTENIKSETEARVAVNPFSELTVEELRKIAGRK